MKSVRVRVVWMYSVYVGAEFESRFVWLLWWILSYNMIFMRVKWSKFFWRKCFSNLGENDRRKFIGKRASKVHGNEFRTNADIRRSYVFGNIFCPQELKSQAAKILGSVDFLGNPLGLFNDVTEGISGLIRDGNVGGLFTNVAHGITNSAAKVRLSCLEKSWKFEEIILELCVHFKENCGVMLFHILRGSFVSIMNCF